MDKREEIYISNTHSKKMGTFYIYVLENNTNKIKIGVTKNFDNRLTSLKGSNGGGNIITRYFCSAETYLYSLESTLHSIYNAYRIKGTEWFEGIKFEEVVGKVNELMHSKSYKCANDIRKKYNATLNNFCVK